MHNFIPFKILRWFILVFITLALISMVMPKNGLRLGPDVTIRFPAIADYFQADTTAVDITDIISIETEEDTVEPIKKIDTSAIAGIVPLDSGVEVKAPILLGAPDALDKFFAALQQTTADGSTVRVMHYGDSQIEADRISGYLRRRLQGQFGGSGPGYITCSPAAECVAVKESLSDGWEKHQAFAGRDKSVPHRFFGPGASFVRFMPIHDSTAVLTQKKQSWIQYSTNNYGGARLINFRNVKMFYGGASLPVTVTCFADDAEVHRDTLLCVGNTNTMSFRLNNAPKKLKFSFSGNDSPDIYGFSFEGDGGVLVDNFALRGSSGEFFTGLSQAQLKSYFSEMDVRLVILQFGGNAIPALQNDTARTARYAKAMESQIRAFQNLAPDASILFVGPSDMSVKEGTEYVTHPLLETLNADLKAAAERTGIAYFDMYAAMGGRNSMVAWVEAGIASKD
ncbi:MAG: GDSL-type esterase/lipase family protein [Chitinophagales bacterium]